MKRVILVGAIAVSGSGALSVLIGGWFLLAAGAQQTGAYECSGGSLDRRAVPPHLVPIFAAAAQQYDLGPRGPAVLAGLTSIESDFGGNQGPSSAGAVGWTQFLPSTWQAFGVDADGDGRADPGEPHDAIHTAARYLRHLGAPEDWRRALFGYNRSQAYVSDVLKLADEFTAASGATTCAPTTIAASNGHVFGGGVVVPIPSQPGETIDRRILGDVLALQRRYRFTVTDGYAATGHAANGEHPLGLAIDVVPGPSGTWDDLDALARVAEPQQNKPAPPFRWVGYNGDAGHGRGDHLHLSWQHGPAAAGNRPPAAWVDVLRR